MLQLQNLDHITIYSNDVEKSVDFYQKVLGLQKQFEWPGEITMLSCGLTSLAIGSLEKESNTKNGSSGTIDHFAFKIDAKTFEDAQRELPKKGIPIEEIQDHGICQSIYFRDPDGNLLELACYEIKGRIERMPNFVGQATLDY